MHNPTVSFVVPCYKLGHLLPQCIASILSQTYSDFEVLIMDDCSPDNTPEVAHSFKDSRIKHIRNEQNLGHLRNYNKGINMSRGKYVWLISADDCLRRPYALQCYVHLMESHPKVGYVFCPGIALEAGCETELLGGYYYGNNDKIFQGRYFLPSLLSSHGILSPSVMARKECYENIGYFPLHMPHQGDMYLWCMWALHYDVAYMAEPMVNYRIHEASMMSQFRRHAPQVMLADELAVLWATKEQAYKLGYRRLSRKCEYFIGCKYARSVASGIYRDKDAAGMSLPECEGAVMRATQNDGHRVLATMYAGIGDEHYWHGNAECALDAYRHALAKLPLSATVWVKYLLLRLGSPGIALRNALFPLHRQRRRYLRPSC